VAETPWPIPHKIPILPALYHRCPQHLGISAAKWSGPDMACNPPENNPPDNAENAAAIPVTLRVMLILSFELEVELVLVGECVLE